MMNIEQIAALLGLKPMTAYYLVTAAVEVGAATKMNAPNPDKKRGRRPQLYTLTPDAGEKLKQLITKWGVMQATLEDLAKSNPPVETVARSAFDDPGQSYIDAQNEAAAEALISPVDATVAA